MKRGWQIIFNFLLVLVILFSFQEGAATAIPQLDSNPTISQLFDQGIEHTKHQNYQQALSDFTEVINRKANFVGSAYSNRCLIHLHLGNNQAAVSDCTAALQLNQDNLEAYLNQGLAEYRLGNYAEAIKQYQEVIQRNDRDYRAYYNQGLAYFAVANYAMATENYQQALLSIGSSSPTMQALIYSDKGLADLMLGNNSLALAELNEAISLNTSNEKAYYNRACVYVKNKNYTAALDDFTAALQLNSQYTLAYLNRGWLRHQLGLEQAALEDLRQALYQFEQQGNTEGYRQTSSLIEHLRTYLAESNRTLVS